MANVIHRLKRRVRRHEETTTPIWRGVYERFEDVPRSGEGFSSVHAAEAAERLLRETESEPMPPEAALDHQVLALAVRLSGARPAHVADFGGGVGQSFAAVRRMVDVPLRYCVIDLPPVIEHARRLWPNGELEFAHDLDSLPFAPDVLFAKGLMQYWPDYGATFRELLQRRIPWIVLEKVPLLSGRQYVTEQVDVYGTGVPYWFVDLNVLLSIAEECGYRLLLQRRLEREYDQSNFPRDLRSERAASLLFERRS